MRRLNPDKVVAQIYLRDWSMKAEILRKAQMYEDTMMHRKSDCTSNNNNNNNKVEMNNLDKNNSNEDIKLFAPTVNCNRSGIYLEKGTSNKFCDTSSADNSMVSLKFKSKLKRNKNNLKMRKYKDILNMINPMIAIDKL
jgi:predicted nuclease of restriction endonuclease-like RecB superfamily